MSDAEPSPPTSFLPLSGEGRIVLRFRVPHGRHGYGCMSLSPASGRLVGNPQLDRQRRRRRTSSRALERPWPVLPLARGNGMRDRIRGMGLSTRARLQAALQTNGSITSSGPTDQRARATFRRVLPADLVVYPSLIAKGRSPCKPTDQRFLGPKTARPAFSGASESAL